MYSCFFWTMPFIFSVSLQKLQGDIQAAEGNEEHHLQMLREVEDILQVKKTEQERLKSQVRLIWLTQECQFNCCRYNWGL